MNDPHVDAALHAACSRIETAVGAVARRLIDTLGASDAGFVTAAQRHAHSNAQFDLRRKLPTFTLVFADTLRQRVLDAARPPKARSLALVLETDTLSLVGDDEVDERVSAEKLGTLIAQACEAELRELDGYVAALLGHSRPDAARNPLRPEMAARALRRAVHATSDDAGTRLLLEQEFARALPAAMQPCCEAIVVALQELGVQPLSMRLRTVQGPGNELPREVHRDNSGYRTSGFGPSAFQPSAFQTSTRDIAQAEHVLSTLFGLAAPAAGPRRADAAPADRPRTARELRPGAGAQSGAGSGNAPRRAAASSVGDGVSDAQMLDVLRRLASLDFDGSVALRAGGASGGVSARASDGASDGAQHRTAPADGAPSNGAPFAPPGMPRTASSSPQAPGAPGAPWAAEPMTGLMAVNVIRQHRDELLRASTGTLDHMVIDVVGALFDQVLSDQAVPPAMARQIARLQLPVLRAALRDVSFFSSRRHPVRRFVNRIASLAAAYEDLEHGPGKAFIDQVQALVQEIVEGDFDQMALYESKLQDIEALIQAQSARDVGAQAPVAALIDSKATQLRIQQHYMRELTARLQAVALPDFLRDFLAQVWSQVQVQAAAPGGSELFAERARRLPRLLATSVQPQGELKLRKAFLMQLPQLMKDLNDGLALIGWPEAATHDFFAKLLPLHSEALKTAPPTDFEQRQLKHQLDQLDKVAIPSAADVQAGVPHEAPALPSQEAALRFSPDEARRIGLVEDTAVDWTGQIDIDLDAGTGTNAGAGGPAATDDVDIVLDALSGDTALPTRGPQLVAHLQTGIAYRMHLEGRWQRVRLNWISPGRGFFVFTHGKAHEKTVSMTVRMIARLCEAERFRAFEQAELLERATARARKQLARLGTPAGAVSDSGALSSQA